MKLDLSLLKRLLVIDHPSKQEWPMLSFIINECYKIGNLEFEMDSYNNIFITKTTNEIPQYYPLVVAHTDCVLAHKNKEVRIKDGNLYGRDSLTGKRIALGMDDAVGVCMAIQLLRQIPDLKVLFTTEEEVGFLGAAEAAENIEFFFNVSYMIQADRRGNFDLITHTNGIYSANEQWLDKITPVMLKYQYKEEYGIGTDVGELAGELGISGVNISCGYNKEHTDKEWMSLAGAQNCLDFMEEIIKTVPLNKQYTIDVQKAWYNYYGNYSSKDKTYDMRDYVAKEYPREYDDYYEDDVHYELPCDHCRSYDCMNCTKFDNYSG